MKDFSRRNFLGAAAVAGAEAAARADEYGAKDKDHGGEAEPIPTFRYAMETEKGRHTEGQGQRI